MNYPGYGRSTGPADLRGIVNAALAAYDHLAARANGKPIFVCGFSLGTAVALCVAARRPVAGLILKSPPPIQKEIIEEYGWWNLGLLAQRIASEVPAELNSLINAPRVKAPAIFILTGDDWTVPVKYQRMVVSAFGGKKRIILLEHSGHNSPIPRTDRSKLRVELDWLWSEVRTGK